MLSQCLVPSITKKVISYTLVLGQQPLIALKMQNYHYISKLIETFFIQNYIYSNATKYKSNNKTPGQTLI